MLGDSPKVLTSSRIHFALTIFILPMTHIKRLYMLRTDMNNIITAIKQIQLDYKFREATKKYQRKVKVVLIPRKTSIIEYTFEQHGVRQV